MTCPQSSGHVDSLIISDRTAEILETLLIASHLASSHSIVHLPYITAAYVVHRRRRSRGGQVSTFQFAVAHCARFGGET
jgi:hypothetical protein